MRIVQKVSLLLAALVVWSAPTARAADKLPSELALVPNQAVAFVHVRCPELWQSDVFKDLRYLVDKAGPGTWKRFESICTPKPADLESMTVIILTPQALGEPFPSVDPEAVSALVAVKTKKPFNRFELRQALGLREKVYRQQLYYFNEDFWSGLVFLDERTFLIGSEDAVVQYFDALREPAKEGSLEPALRAAAGKHTIVVGVNPQTLARDKEIGALPQNLQPLLQARCAVITLDLDDAIRLDMRLIYGKDEDAKAGEQAVQAVLGMAVVGLAFPLAEVERELKAKTEKADISNVPEAFAMVVAMGFLREVESMLKNVDVKRENAEVRVPFQFKKTDSMPLLAFSMMGVSVMGRNAFARFDSVASEIGGQRNPHEDHLRTLANALERYHDDKKSYPPAATFDKDGRPLLSWRVALLPYVGEEVLYREFKLDEPWDSLHNKKLIKKLPKALQAPGSWRKGRTHDLVFTGENTIFQGKQGVKKADVAGKTILLVITSGEENSVYWTKPADLEFAVNKPIPELFGKYQHQCHLLFADGTYRRLNKEMADEKVLRSLIQRQGEKLKLPGEEKEKEKE